MHLVKSPYISKNTDENRAHWKKSISSLCEKWEKYN